MYKQVISFNPSKAGTRAGWCLQNVRKGFGIGSKYPTAWQAWLHTQQHKDPAPVGEDVPLFYSYVKAGVNFGHINVRLKSGKVWSDGKLYNSIADYESKHRSVHYVGWGESINGVQVLKYVAPPKPVVSMPHIGSSIVLTAPVDRTTFKNGTVTIAGHLKFKTNEVYIVRGYDKKYKNRILINSASAGGNGVALALYYTNGQRISGWKQA
jgi:hypothetical protein